MDSKKTSSNRVNKSDFVRNLPSGMSAADVVKAAKARGIEMTDGYVHTVRYNAKKALATPRAAPAKAPSPARVKRGPGRPKKELTNVAAPAAKRGPGRPRKSVAASVAPVRQVTGSAVGHGLAAELEALVARIVEIKIGEVLRSRLARLA